MNRRLAFFALLFAGCVPPKVQGGSNANDRSNGGEQGETLLTGAMIVAPDGKYILAQRNETSVLVDVEKGSAQELTEQVDRFVFAKTGARAIAVLDDHTTVVAYDLPSLAERWRADPPFSGTGAVLARLSDDGANLVLGDSDQLFVLDAEQGTMRGVVDIGTEPTELAFVPGSSRALVVGTTAWVNHQPRTDVVDVDLVSLHTSRVSVPNCAAPVVVLPDASRALLSPTFCEEGRTTAQQGWTNPDPVSVIDLAAEGPRFLRNLPGFGPVAMDPAGTRAVAYLDVQRMDTSMFEDKTKIPSLSGPRYHVMTIDPKSLAYELSPVGNVLPRFVMAKNAKSLLVDATVQQFRGEAKFQATLDTSGKLTTRLEVFGATDSLFGLFDLDTHAYVPFGGAASSLDRFVQYGDGVHVYTLKLTADGMGGDLYRIDLDARMSTSLGKSFRDIGLLADAKMLVLRERLPAVQVKTSAGATEWYRRERFCFSLDGISCTSSVEFQDSKPFQTAPACTDYHDC
jgi:hypothetical protein